MVQILVGLGVCACVILVLSEYIWNAPTVSLVLSTFDDTGSLGSPLSGGLYPWFHGSTLSDFHPFPYGGIGRQN